MAVIPKLDDANSQVICDILGDTITGLTGSEIGRYLRECDCSDPIPKMTKQHRLYNALLRNRIPTVRQQYLGFITHVMNPVRHVRI
jgi:hypothetical protein